MTRIIRNLAEIGGDYGVLFCDLWGCVHNGKMAYPAAIAALQAYRAKGGKVALVTNAPRPRSLVADQIARLGVPDDAWDDISRNPRVASAIPAFQTAQDGFADAVERTLESASTPRRTDPDSEVADRIVERVGAAVDEQLLPGNRPVASGEKDREFAERMRRIAENVAEMIRRLVQRMTGTDRDDEPSAAPAPGL